MVKLLDEKPMYSIASVDKQSENQSTSSNDSNSLENTNTSTLGKEGLSNNNSSSSTPTTKTPVEEYESIIKSKLSGISVVNSSSNHNANNNTSMISNNPALGISSNKTLPTGLLTFLDTLELEYFRISSNITPQERDTLLLENKYDIESFNPDRFIHPRDEKTERKTVGLFANEISFSSEIQ